MDGFKVEIGIAVFLEVIFQVTTQLHAIQFLKKQASRVGRRLVVNVEAY